MTNIKYVIRHNEFAYNDEWYETNNVTVGSIKAIYTDKAEAQQAYKSLIIEALYESEDLSMFDIGNGYATEEVYEKIVAFILEKTGEEFDSETLPEMNKDDAFEFAQLSGILHYQLIEIDDTKPTHVIFLPQNQQYIHVESYNNSLLLASQSNNPLFDFEYSDDYLRNETIDSFFDALPKVLTGSLTELSESPTLLEEWIKSQQLIYDHSKQQLSIHSLLKESSFDQLSALNALLKQLLFEIRQVTLEELAELESK